MEQLVDACTSENNMENDWNLIIQTCEHANLYYSSLTRNDKKAKEAVQAIIQKLASKNINVILYSLTLAHSLVQNCGLKVKQEICSRPFITALLRLVNDSKTHQTVRNRILDLIQTWQADFKGQPSLEYMNAIYEELKESNTEFPVNVPARKEKNKRKEQEDDELQLALAISLSAQYIQPSIERVQKIEFDKRTFQVKALYDFNPTDSGELMLKRGDIIDVHDHTTYPDWWNGTCRELSGIFPANYVEKINGLNKTGEINRPSNQNQDFISTQTKMVENLKYAITQADPLGHNQTENEKLKFDYQNIVGSVPAVLKLAGEQRKEQGHFI